MDLSKVPTEDLQAIKDGKWDKVSTPGLQAYQAARQHDAQVTQQAQNPQQIPDNVDKAAQGGKPNAQPLSLSQNRFFPASYSPGGQPAAAAEANPQANKMFANIGTGLAVGGAAGAATQGLTGLTGLAARTGVNAGGGALQQYLSNKENGRPGSEGVGAAAALGGGVSLAGEGVSALAGKLGDYLMQKSVGMRKYMPGMGTNLADQGVVGTKNMMANQVDTKLGEQEGYLQDLVKDLKGTVNSSEIADAVGQKAKQFTLPSTGQASPFSQAELSKVRDMSDKLGGMGDLSAQDLLALKRQGDYMGYTNAGNQATSTEASLGRAGANAARGALKEMSPDVADTLLNEQALLTAQKGLTKPETIHQGVGSSLFFGKVPGQSLAGSVAGQTAVKGGQLAGTMSAPQTLQGLFGLLAGSEQNPQKSQ